MAQYSKEEIEQFRKKDKRISMQGLVQVILATGANVNEVEQNCNLAKKYSDYIELLAEGEVEKQPESALPNELQLTTPSLQQKKVLDYIAKQLGVEVDDSLKKEVLDWVEKTYGKKDLYPGKNETAKLFIQEKKK